MTKTDHVVYNGKTQHIECKACCAKHPLKLPMSVTMFCDMGKAFEKEHRRCAAKRKKKCRI